MTIKAGTRLGPYEVLAPIGAGGMGEVYKAKDTRLDRTVAIKVLPTHLAESPERKARFEREAKAISQLNHPHICTLYDVGEQDGIDFIVMEYIEGETLAERLKKGALKLDQALEYGTQIADGLDKAHRAGIVHRDLKPGNVMLTKPGGVKLLDFGLAKHLQDQPVAEGSDAPTQQRELTGEQAILGTLQYMAPEQLEGRQADARTDIFAFGTVLYEMLTGAKAFTGTSQASLIGSILKDEPRPMAELRSLTPPMVERIVQRCLAKDPEDRWQSARDLVLELGTKPVAAPSGPMPSRQPGLILAFGAAVVAAALTGFFLGEPPVSRAVKRVAINVPAKDSNEIALSPDGNVLAYTALDQGVSKIFVHALADGESLPVDGSEGARFPFFSPDARELGFAVGNEVKKVALSGGLPTTIGEIPPVAENPAWAEDGSILVGSGSGLWHLRGEGGESERLTRFDHSEVAHGDPVILPGGRAALFSASFGVTSRIGVVSIDTGELRFLIDGSRPMYSRSGHLVYVHQGTLWAVRFDANRLEVSGSPVAIETDVLRVQNALARDGTLVYGRGATEVVWIDREGRTSRAFDGAQTHLRVSPNGQRLVGAEGSDVWILDPSRHTRERLTFEGDNAGPLWSPDGDRVVFGSSRGDRRGLYWKPADGSGAAEPLVSAENSIVALTWTPDGGVLAFERADETGRFDIWVLVMDGGGGPEKLIGGPFNETAAKFSPDGTIIAYASDESGRFEVYAQPYPGPGSRSRVSAGGGVAPVWSPDGSEIFYVHAQQMFAVPVRREPTLAFGSPRPLFEGAYNLSNVVGHPHYDVAPDGRFVAMRQEAGLPSFEVILNFDQELERLLPIED